MARLDPFGPGLDMEDRQSRIAGRLLRLERHHEGQTWDEDITCTGLRAFDETSGIIALYGLTGRQPRNFDPYRECGQMRTIHIDEIIKRATAKREKAATRAPRAKSENSFIIHAETILRAKGKPMHVKEITAAALKAGLTTSGKTPDATMGARLGGAPERFEKLGKGMFDLKS